MFAIKMSNNIIQIKLIYVLHLKQVKLVSNFLA